MTRVLLVEAGADNFIRKPADPSPLEARPRAAVHNRKPQETSRARMGVQIGFLGRSFDVTGGRQQILDLLISTFEELVGSACDLQERVERLDAARAALARRVAELEAENGRLRDALGRATGSGCSRDVPRTGS